LQQKRSRANSFLGASFSNWKRRFFVLRNGFISYYESFDEKSEEAKGQKGKMSLINANIVESPENTAEDSRRIYISGSSAEAESDLLMEADTVHLADKWKKAVREHCKYATVHKRYI